MRVAALIVAGLASIAACIPADQVVTNVKQITTLSRNLQVPAKGLTVLDGPLLAVGQGNFPRVIQGLAEIVSVTTGYISVMDPETYDDDEADIIFEAFREFVKVHQALLNTLIRKSGLFTTVPFVGQPVAAVLRAVEGVVSCQQHLQTLASTLIDMLESRTEELKQEADSLSSTLSTTIDSYSGLSL